VAGATQIGSVRRMYELLVGLNGMGLQECSDKGKHRGFSSSNGPRLLAVIRVYARPCIALHRTL
jgi:hypothetical protein